MDGLEEEPTNLELQLRMIIAYARNGNPKEPKDTYVQQIMEAFRNEGWTPNRYGEVVDLDEVHEIKVKTIDGKFL